VEEVERSKRKTVEEKERLEDERTRAFDEINKLHALIEAMEKSIEEEKGLKNAEIEKVSEIQREV
jgi:hypothetical protein